VFGTRDARLLSWSDPARRRRCHRGECDKIAGGDAHYGGMPLSRSAEGPRSAVGPHESAGLGRVNREGGTFQRRGETRVPLFHRHTPRLLQGPKPCEAAIGTLSFGIVRDGRSCVNENSDGVVNLLPVDRINEHEGARRPGASVLCGGGKARDVLPGVESLPQLLTVFGGGEKMTSQAEVLRDGTIRGEEALRMPR
jgi:hypothetical protein